MEEKNQTQQLPQEVIRYNGVRQLKFLQDAVAQRTDLFEVRFMGRSGWTPSMVINEILKNYQQGER